MRITDRDVFLIIDVQNDFCPGGALAVSRGDEVVPLVNRLVPAFANVVFTQDWHPAGHVSFASSHPSGKPFETIMLGSESQVLWPDHCVQHTYGAALHKHLNAPNAQLILRKGFHPNIDSYSAFRENDRITRTGLAAYLVERGIDRVFLAGLAYDYCVRASAVDATTAGFSALVIKDACRAIGLNASIEQTCADFARTGVLEINSADLF